MDKEFVKKQLKISKKQNMNERYEYLNSQFNAINYTIKLEKYTKYLEQQLKKKDEVIETAIQELKQGITFCENDSQGVHDKCNIAISREKRILQILEDEGVE